MGISNVIHAGAGNDTVTINGIGCYVYGEDGDDTININHNDSKIDGGNGNDTFNILQYGTSLTIYGGDGDDTFIANSSHADGRYYGEGGNDEFSILKSKNTGITIDGGIGTNKVLTDNGKNTIKVNVENPNAYSVDFTGNETKEILINGIKYTVSEQNNQERAFIYRINGSTIEFLSSNFSITGQKDKAHDVKLTATGIAFRGGDLADKITTNTSGIRAYIYAGAGNDTIQANTYECKIYGEDGDDVISNSCSYLYNNSVIDGGNGNDTLNITNTTREPNSIYYTIKGGAGDDTFNLTGHNILVQGNDGDDHFNVISGTNCMIMGGAGTNTMQNNGTDTLMSNISNITSNLTEIRFSSKNETKTVTIAGKQYTIKNDSDDGDNTLAYRYNEATGEITFIGNHFEIRGAENQVHNLIIYGESNNIYGGKLNDKINLKGCNNLVYGGAGDDTIINNCWIGNTIYGEDGNDEIILNERNDGIVSGGKGNDTINITYGGAKSVNGGEGNDTYIISGSDSMITDPWGTNSFDVKGDNNVVTGGSGSDSFTVTGSNNSILGAGGDDYNIILGSNNSVDGGTGLNFYVDAGSNNTYTNVSPDPNSQTITFVTQNQTKEILLNGKKYTFINTNHDNTSPASNKVTYVYNPSTGEMNIIGSNITLICDDSSSNDIKLYGDNNVIQGGSKNDSITVESGTGNYIYGNDGNDKITMNSENNHLFGGSGNDNITVNASNGTNEIDGGDGNDTLTINSDNNTAISSGSGSNTLNINGSGNKNIAGTGSETINITGSNNEITSSDSNNEIRVSGSDNTVTSGTGSDEIVVSGTGNALNDNGGDNKINISGNENTLQAGSGSDSITIKGDKNTANAGDGNDTITVSGNQNIMTGGAGDDEFIVNGGKENNLDGNDGYNTMLNYGVNTIFTNVHDITPDGVRLQIGANSDSASAITVDTSLYIGEFTIDFSTEDSAAQSIETIDALLEKLQTKQAQIGAAINRLNSALDSQTTQIENLTASRSTIMDADIAQESADYVKNQILQQTSAALLTSTQNFNASIILSLIG